MKTIIKLILSALAVLGILFVYNIFFASQDVISDDQKKVRSNLGLPEQFMISYVPRGGADNPKLARSEVWFYAKHQKKISFLAGDLVSAEEFIPAEKGLPPTVLRPEDFSLNMAYEDIAFIIGELNIKPLEIPAFYQSGEVEAYASDKILFILESGYLTYIQTVGIGGGVLEEDFLEADTEPEDSLSGESFILPEDSAASSSASGAIASSTEE